ncbi:MAG: acyl-CoA thioesterase [Paracoccaceae bacterium]
MYPYIRMFHQLSKFKGRPMGLFDTHISHHMCWPQDIDPWMELNNGRALTLYDLGRVPMAVRMGFDKLGKSHGWGLTVAGASTRYRRRVRMFDRFEMRSKVIGWDQRFLYMDQSMWRGAECTSQMLLRAAVASKDGIVAPEKVVAAMGHPADSPALPQWVQAWSQADAQRPWPPQTGLR